jgi:hypothetical protein
MNAVLVLVVLTTGHESDATLRTYATLSALLAPAANTEVTNTGYARIVLDEGDIAAASVDTATHRTTLPLANQTFSTISAGDSWSKLVICYDSDSAGGTDANIVPMALYDLRISNAAIVPNGNDIIIAAPSGYIVAS